MLWSQAGLWVSSQLCLFPFLSSSGVIMTYVSQNIWLFASNGTKVIRHVSQVLLPVSYLLAPMENSWKLFLIDSFLFIILKKDLHPPFFCIYCFHPNSIFFVFNVSIKIWVLNTNNHWWISMPLLWWCNLYSHNFDSGVTTCFDLQDAAFFPFSL